MHFIDKLLRVYLKCPFCIMSILNKIAVYDTAPSRYAQQPGVASVKILSLSQVILPCEEHRMLTSTCVC